MQSLCASVTDMARHAFGAAACSLAVVDDEAQELLYLTASGAGADAITGTRMSIGRGLAGWVAQSGQAIMVSDLGQDRRFARDIAESTSYIPTTLMAVPVDSDDGLLGVLTVLDRDASRRGAERDLELATMFATQASAALQVRAAFSDVDTVLLETLRQAAGSGGTLAEALTAVAPAERDGATLEEFSVLLSELRRAGPREQQLALRILREVLEFVGPTGYRPPGSRG
jgi:GAF domain-containing protein